MRKLLTLTILAIFSSIISVAQSAGFIENKGQWNNKVKFTASYGSSNFFLQSTGYKVSLNSPGDMKALAGWLGHHNGDKSQNALEAENKKMVLHSHAYEIKFVGAASSAEIIAEDEAGANNNYFAGTDRSKWVAGCKIYHSVTYKNIYPGIDVRYYTSDNRFKYDFIINPGADISKIALVFDGVNELSKENDNLIIKTSLGNISELKPYTYQENNLVKTTVNAQFQVSGNKVYFKVGDYNKNNKLVIDPSLIFSTFSGSTADNWGYASAYDKDGNFYLAGIVFGTGFPVSNGAYQTNFGGGSNEGQMSGYDIAILKLNNTGTDRLYATYLGGTGNEEPRNLWVNNNDELLISGITNSANFPTTAATVGHGGNKDIFIAKLNASGTTLLASRKIGGTSDDGINIRGKEFVGPVSIKRNYSDDARSELTTDAANNIYFASCTQSSDFPTSQNSFQKTLIGNQDAVLVKLSSDLTTVFFSTFLGGSGDDAAFSLALLPVSNHIYVAGSTTSTDLQTSGTDDGPVLYKTFRGGVCDGYIAEISNDGSNLINMRYVGTSGNDMLYELAIDNSGYPYIMGATTVAFPVINAAFNSQSNGKQFITKLDAGLSQVLYSTNFGKGGSAPDIAPTAFGLDECENVYVAGFGGGINQGEGYPNEGTTGLSATADAIRSTTDGSDFYIFVLEKNAISQLYGTFYGNIDQVPGVGDHTDGGNSRFDRKGNLYLTLCANCALTGIFPTTPGAWAPTNMAQTGAQCSMAAVKISWNPASCLLPVTFTSFIAAYGDHKSVLKWKTAQEISSNYFDIEHSTDAQQFSSLGRVNAAGNSSIPVSYSYIHHDPAPGLHYYRLKSTDKNGKSALSAVVSVLVNDPGKTIYLYPNPAKSVITVIYPRLQQETGIIILNSKGATVRNIQLPATSTKAEINIQALPAGWYMLLMVNEGKKQSISFLKE